VKNLKKFFELKLQGSQAVNQFEKVAQMPASNIAYHFFKNLDKESDRYNFIRSVIIFESGKEYTKEYTTEELKIVKSKMRLVEQIIDILKRKDYQSLEKNLNDSVVEYDKREIVNTIKNADEQVGGILGFNLLGFRFIQYNQDANLLHISGVLKREKTNVNFSVDVNSGPDEIYLVRYEL
jgi:hypothetical protein